MELVNSGGMVNEFQDLMQLHRHQIFEITQATELRLQKDFNKSTFYYTDGVDGVKSVRFTLLRFRVGETLHYTLVIPQQNDAHDFELVVTANVGTKIGDANAMLFLENNEWSMCLRRKHVNGYSIELMNA